MKTPKIVSKAVKISSIFLIILLCMITGFNTKAQTPKWLWSHSLGVGTTNEYGSDIIVDPVNGDIYTTGSFSGTVDFDPGTETYNLSAVGINALFISKVDESGKFIWAKTIGSKGGSAEGSSIALDPSGNIYTTGFFTGQMDFDPGPEIFNVSAGGDGSTFISKLDKEGNFVWAGSIRGIGTNYSNSIFVDPLNGNIYLTGTFDWFRTDFDPGEGINILGDWGNEAQWTIYIAVIDSSGNGVWAKEFGGHSAFLLDVGISLTANPLNGDVYMTGQFHGTCDFDPGPGTYDLTSNGEAEIFISKFDRTGTLVWAKTIGGLESDAGHCIIFDPRGSGSIYTTGHFNNTVDFNPDSSETFNLSSAGSSDIFILKLDGSGNFVWANSLGGAGDDYGSTIVLDPNGNGELFISGGFSNTADLDPGQGIYNLTSSGEADIFITKLDSLGNYVWVKSVGGIKNDRVGSIALDQKGYVHMTGNFASPSIQFDKSVTISNADPTGVFTDLFVAKLDALNTVPVVETTEENVNIYPNPVKNELTIELEGETAYVGIAFYNILGRIVLSGFIENTISQKTIDISSLTSGIYLIELDMDGNRMMKKIVKE